MVKNALKSAALWLLDKALDWTSAIVFALSYSLFIAFKEISDYVGETRRRNNWDTAWFERPYDYSTIYRMALEIPRPRKGEKVTIRSVWEKFPHISKRQACRVRDQVMENEKKCLRSCR